MNTLDIIIAVILLVGGLNGLRQGFVKAFANLVGWVCALVLAARYATVIAPMMSGLSHDPVVQKIAAFAAIVLVIISITWLLGAFLNQVFKSLKLGPLNRLVGGAFGGFKALMVVLIAMHGLGPWVESSPLWKQSKLIQTLLPYAPMATEFSKQAANQAYEEMQSGGRQPDNSVSNENARSPAQVQKNSAESSHSTPNPFY